MKKSANMSSLLSALLAISCLIVVGCNKKTPDATAVASASAVVNAPTAATPAPKASQEPAEETPEQQEMAKKKALMDYAKMEDQYINDSKAQWARDAKASSTFGEKDGSGPSSSNLATNAKGPVDGKDWTNNNQDIGFDWLELSYEKPVAATEVRVVFEGGDGVEAISKIELQSTDGKWNTVWEGISDQKRDNRGSRTWYVRSFEKTNYKAKAVKVTLANNLERGYKVIDAVQLVGE
ncbi:hypothetical protein [Undibacterium sp. Di24W]|uniref:hypothetical protein n=1 Tax=Undibacterium sp. Di24W TaxID=3413033 RepID=UPI003BEFECF0